MHSVHHSRPISTSPAIAPCPAKMLCAETIENCSMVCRPHFHYRESSHLFRPPPNSWSDRTAKKKSKSKLQLRLILNPICHSPLDRTGPWRCHFAKYSRRWNHRGSRNHRRPVFHRPADGPRRIANTAATIPICTCESHDRNRCPARMMCHAWMCGMHSDPSAGQSAMLNRIVRRQCAHCCDRAIADCRAIPRDQFRRIVANRRMSSFAAGAKELRRAGNQKVIFLLNTDQDTNWSITQLKGQYAVQTWPQPVSRWHLRFYLQHPVFERKRTFRMQTGAANRFCNVIGRRVMLASIPICICATATKQVFFIGMKK